MRKGGPSRLGHPALGCREVAGDFLTPQQAAATVSSSARISLIGDSVMPRNGAKQQQLVCKACKGAAGGPDRPSRPAPGTSKWISTAEPGPGPTRPGPALDGADCDKHPKKMTVAQAVNPMTDVPSEVRSLQRQHSTLEVSPLITIITRWLVTAWFG